MRALPLWVGPGRGDGSRRHACGYRLGLVLLAVASGCGTRTPPLTPLRPADVRAQVPGARVLTLDRLPGTSSWWLRDSDASDLTAPELRAITTEPAWHAWWQRAAGLSRQAAPHVEFGRAIVLTAAMGVRPAGSRIMIDGAAVRQDTLFVLVRHENGVPGACRTDGTVNPVAVALVTLPAPRAVVFRERQVTYAC